MLIWDSVKAFLLHATGASAQQFHGCLAGRSKVHAGPAGFQSLAMWWSTRCERWRCGICRTGALLGWAWWSAGTWIAAMLPSCLRTSWTSVRLSLSDKKRQDPQGDAAAWPFPGFLQYTIETSAGKQSRLHTRLMLGAED